MNWSLLILPLIPLVFLAGIALVLVASDDIPHRFFESQRVRMLVWSLLLAIGVGAVALVCAALTNWAIS